MLSYAIFSSLGLENSECGRGLIRGRRCFSTYIAEGGELYVKQLARIEQLVAGSFVITCSEHPRGPLCLLSAAVAPAGSSRGPAFELSLLRRPERAHLTAVHTYTALPLCEWGPLTDVYVEESTRLRLQFRPPDVAADAKPNLSPSLGFEPLYIY